ncbi:AsmA family protein [Halomonas eurihalina]|uniref:AsmA family protein n=1 Tax=Halomonas eurihalina TaxID=42566 RepID=A0A5D9DBQ9_HALER|nr:AsmA family protein [Halomonas eurihalina]MDR5859247.1 AsmA family protein [Halomonas eurihalina]TZG40933.1 AsmA family protein [Halomonas eurihalina]
MKRILRTLLATIGILGLVAVGAVVFVTTFFDPEDLKPRLVEVVREHSGLELELDGPLNWSFYPRLGVGVEAAEARLPNQSSDERPFAAIDHAEVSLAFAPLLRGEIAIDGLTLEGLLLNLARDESGRGNWETLIERLESRGEEAEAVLAPASAGPNPDAESSESGLSVALNIASVQVHQGQVNYRDAQAERHVTLEQLNITGHNVNPDRPFPLNASLRVLLDDDLDTEAATLASDIILKTRVDLGLTEGRHVFQELSLQTDSRFGDAPDTQKLNLTAAEAILDLSEQHVTLTDGQLDTSLLHPRLGEKRLALAMGLQLDADLEAQTAQLRELHLTGPDSLELTGNLNVTELFTAPSYRGQLQLEPLSLRPWLTRLDAMPATASDTALSDVSLTSPVEGDLQSITLDGLTLGLDGSTFSGRLAGQFDGSSLSANLQGDTLDLDAYLPPDAPSSETSASLPLLDRAYAEQSPTLLPASWLADLDLDTRLELGELHFLRQNFRNVTLALEGQEGHHRLTRFEADLHDGQLSATGSLDARETPLRWQLSPNVTAVRLGDLLESLGDEPAPLQGLLEGSGELESQGNSLTELKRALNGHLETRLTKGRLTETNVSQQLCTTAARLQGEQTSREWEEGTSLQRTEASFEIRDGVAESDDLAVTIPGIDMNGQGQLDVASERFDLKANARFTDTVDAACEVNPRLKKVPFPVHCEGQLSGDSNEWCRFDRQALQASLGELLRQEASQRAGEEIDKRLEDAMDKLEEKAGGELRGTLESLLK